MCFVFVFEEVSFFTFVLDSRKLHSPSVIPIQPNPNRSPAHPQMKTPKKTAKSPAEKSKKVAVTGSAKQRKMEPMSAKEMKNVKFDDMDEEDDVDQIEPEIIEDNFKAFDDLYDDEDDDL